MIGVMQGRLSVPMSEKIQEFPWQTWEKEFEKAGTIGIEQIEWTLDHHQLYKNPLMTQEGRLKIENIKAQKKILLNSVTLDCFLQSPIHRPHPQTNLQSSIEDFISIVKASGKLGIRIGVLPLVAESGNDDRESLSSLFELLNDLRSVSDLHQFKVALECEFDTSMLLWIAKQTESLHHIGFNFDIGNSASLGNSPIEEIEIYGEKLLNVHIKDRKLGGPTVPLGQGNADFSLVARVLADTKYTGNMILQAARKLPGEELETVSSYLRFCESFGWQ